MQKSQHAIAIANHARTTALECTRYVLESMHIRASVDALYRDGTSEISRDPHTKRLLTRRECLARP